VRLLNDLRPWWGLYDPQGHDLSIVDLIDNATLTVDQAAQVWWALDRGASMWVVAGPQGAGKTTLATALLPLLPDSARLYVTSGPRDQLLMPEDHDNLYLLVNELSWHLPFYLSGRAAARAFQLLAEGVRIVGTLHARSAAEALVVMCDAVPRSIVARASTPMLVVALAAWRTPSGIARKVTDIGVLRGTGTDVEVGGLEALPDGELEHRAGVISGWIREPSTAPRFHG
jgi:hypothetical protein